MRISIIITLVAMAILAGGCHSNQDSTVPSIAPEPDPGPGILDPRYLADLRDVDCWFDTAGHPLVTTCYRMHVPQVYGDRDSQSISFPVVRLSNAVAKSPRSPILHLGGGGPGNPLGLESGVVETWLWNWYQQMSVHQNRDLYLIDPRGVGLADPVLNCHEYVPAFLDSVDRNLTLQQEIQWSHEISQSCFDRLVDSGIELAAYNSTAIARDMEMLRRQLAIPQSNLYGVSYASRYALTLAREFPESVESMVLDAVVFPNLRYMENYATDLQQAYDQLLRHCQQSKNCGVLIDDPETRFWQLAHQLEKQPITGTVIHPPGNQQVELVLNGRRFLDIVYNALYDARNLENLDQIILALESGQFGPFEKQISEWFSFQVSENYGDASATAHYCFEESPFIDYALAIKRAEQLRPELQKTAIALLEYSREQCQQWAIPPAPAREVQPVEATTPILVLHGALDPVLPARNLATELARLENADYEIFDDIAHSVVGVHPCGERLASAFYNYKLRFRDHDNCLAEFHQAAATIDETSSSTLP